MKTINKLFVLGSIFTLWLICGVIVKAQAQPLPLEIAECQDFFGSLERGDLNSIKSCLSKKPEYINKLDDMGLTPLMVASREGQSEVVSYLLKGGAVIDAHTLLGLRAIHLAAKSGDVETVELLLEHGADVNALTSRGTAPIHYGIWSGNLKMAQLLEKNGADMHKHGGNGGNLLNWSAMAGNVEMFKYFESKNIDIKNKDFDGDGMLHWAASGSSPKMCDFLIKERSFDIKQQNTAGNYPIEVGIRFRQFETTMYFLSNGIYINDKNKEGASWLHIAASSGSTIIAKYLIDNGVKINDIDINGSTPLNQAAASGNLELVKLLVDRGAEVNPKDCFGGSCNRVDGSPLHNSVWRNAAVVNYLIAEGAKVDQVNQNGETPLHIATWGRNIDCVKALVEAGADINKQDNEGKTPLHKAIKRERNEIIEYLLTQNVDLNLKDYTGKTPVHLASICGFCTHINAITKQGGDFTIKDNEGNSPLFYANYFGNTNSAKALLKAGAKEEVFVFDDFCNKELKKGEAVIWYLNHSGFAIKTAHNLLVFDYWQPNQAPDKPCLNNGHICSKQLKNEKVTVFVSHTHRDHYDKTIFDWKEEIKDIAYILGFEDNVPVNYTYIEPKVSEKVNGIKITTIESTDTGEGFLVEVDGISIYHPGDHANGNQTDPSDHNEEIDFLANINNNVDIAFFPITGCRFRDKIALKQGIYYSVEKLNPKIAFTMHGTTNEDEYKKFAKEANEKVVGQPFLYTLNKGDRYFYVKGKEDTSDL